MENLRLGCEPQPVPSGRQGKTPDSAFDLHVPIRDLGGNKDNFFYQALSYQCNVQTVRLDQEPTSSNRGVRLSAVRQPSGKLFLHDAGCYNFYLPGTGKTPGCTTDPNHGYVSAFLDDFYNGRHLRSINGVFLDGHAESIASDTAWHHKSLGANSSVSMFNILK